MSVCVCCLCFACVIIVFVWFDYEFLCDAVWFELLVYCFVCLCAFFLMVNSVSCVMYCVMLYCLCM